MPNSDRLAGGVPRRKRRALFVGRLATVASGIVAVGLLAPILLEAGRPPERAVGSRSVEGGPDVNAVGPKPEVRSAGDEPAGVSEQPPGRRSGELANWTPERRVPGSAPIVGSSPVRSDRTSTTEPPVVLLPAGRRPSDIAAAASDQDLQRLQQEGGQAAGLASRAGDAPPSVPAPSVSPNEVDASAQAETKAAAGSDPGSGVPATTAALPANSDRPDASGDREGAGKRRSKAAAAAAPQAETQEARSRDRKPRAAPEKPALERQASAGRTRNPATQPPAPATPAAPPALAQPAPDRERVRLLGIPLPTGSEVRQCLLEFRC